jgi:hypothetical protein
MTFQELQDEVGRRAARNNATQFETAIKNIINTSLFRIGREAYWRVLRRKMTFSTKTSYTTGSGAVTVTNGSANVTITGATLLTDGIQIGRFIEFGGNSDDYTIAQITGETTLVLNKAYEGTSSTAETYAILPQEEYNLPIQATHRSFLWHEDYGYPYQLKYVTDQDFFSRGIDRTEINTPVAYRMWGVDMVIEQLKAPSVITVVSSSASDTSKVVTIHGIVSGYPDYEEITSNGITPVSGTKSFSSVERVVKSGVTVGRISVTANSGNTTVAVIPVGDITEGIQYRKLQLYPLPSRVFDIHVHYYKDVYSLVSDYDVHELGAEFDEAIILLSSAKIQFETGQQEGVNFYSLYQDEIKSLKRTNVDKVDYLTKLGGSQHNDSSMYVHPFLKYGQLGGFYGPTVS